MEHMYHVEEWFGVWTLTSSPPTRSENLVVNLLSFTTELDTLSCTTMEQPLWGSSPYRPHGERMSWDGCIRTQQQQDTTHQLININNKWMKQRSSEEAALTAQLTVKTLKISRFYQSMTNSKVVKLIKMILISTWSFYYSETTCHVSIPVENIQPHLPNKTQGKHQLRHQELDP